MNLKHNSILEELLQNRLSQDPRAWWSAAGDEVSRGCTADRFCILISEASRQARQTSPLAPTEVERNSAAAALAGWNPERWSILDAVRVSLVWSRPDLDRTAGVVAIEEAFKFADEGELVTLYRSLQGLPDGKLFLWRASEGCRTNMRTVFEANVLDTGFPAAHFDEIAWKQAVIKCIFVGAPLWRLYGLDARLSPDLARMALDLADERRSAHRPVPHELWLCLGAQGGERALASLEKELSSDNALGRCAAAYALARAGAAGRVSKLVSDPDPEVVAAARSAATGNFSQLRFRALDANAQNRNQQNK